MKNEIDFYGESPSHQAAQRSMRHLASGETAPLIQLIALDLDGTLTSEDHITVSDANRAALRRAHQNGARIAIATGRARSIIGTVCEQVPEIDYIMHSNGAAVYDRTAQKTIYENAMSWDVAGRVLDYLDGFPIFMEVYHDGKSYAQNDRIAYFSNEVLPSEFTEQALQGMTLCDSLCETLAGKKIEKITPHIFDKALYQRIWEHLKTFDELEITTSFSVGIDITAAGADKGEAMAALCRLLGIGAEACMAFGDESNDIPMLTFAKYGFAMANGSAACQAAAPYQTDSNAEDGVARGILKIMFPNA